MKITIGSNERQKSAQRDANTARPPQSPHRLTESAMAVVRPSQKFSPTADTLPGGAWPPKFNQLGYYLHLETQFGEDRCTQFRVIVVTDTARTLHTLRQDRLQYTAPQLASAKCNQLDMTSVCVCVQFTLQLVFNTVFCQTTRNSYAQQFISSALG